jgi:hypothetical protein
MLKYNFINNRINNIVLPIHNEFDYIPNVEFNDQINNITSDVVDTEIKKYRLATNVNMVFRFFKNNTYANTFINAGFEENEIRLSNRNYRFSYVLMQIFDSIDFKTQNLLHSSYIPTYLFPEDKINTNFGIVPSTKYYEFNNIYIPNNVTLVNNQTLFCNFKFYSAKTGRLAVFFNQSKTTNTQDRFYFELKINTNNYTYSFTNINLVANEFVNEEYINKINELSKTENKVPVYPQGTLFDINGNYI